MCGICGIAGFGSMEEARRMASALVHRGPDESGEYEARSQQIFLASRRLIVIDPEGGSQPVFSEDRSVVAIQNGEIYNFRELRQNLEERGHRFLGRSDTEVIPHLYEEYGAAFPEKLRGIYAIALFDRSRQRLILLRDRMGIKPLYVWRRGAGLAFASEVKAFLDLPGFQAARNDAALHFLLNIRFIPGRQTLFRGVEKLPPATMLVWEQGRSRESRYWSPPRRAASVSADRREVAAEVRSRLERAVDRQLVSDVPLGLYLSGGLDSSTLVALAARRGSVETFSLGFNEPTDELADARAVASHFGTNHYETTVPMDAMSALPEVTWHVEEPKENAAQLYLLSRFASRSVRVALSGLGGDELFCGYRIFDYLKPLDRLERLLGRRLSAAVLRPVRRLVGVLLGALPGMRFDLFRRGADLAISLGLPELSYLVLRNMWEHDRRLCRLVYTDRARASIEASVGSFFAPWFEGGLVEGALGAEFAFKMVDDFLMNEDRCSMAHSLEVRVPFLDEEVAEYVLALPAALVASRPKGLLRDATRDLLPPFVFRKKKWGFTFDSYEQFRKDLCRVARRELTPAWLQAQGIVRPEFVASILAHKPHPGMRWHYFLLWLVLGLKVWDKLFLERKEPGDVFQDS